jgi:tetratricopeptide (TPR) repeat protein
MGRQYEAVMSRLYAPLSSASAWVVGGITSVIVGVFGTYVYDELSEPRSSSIKVSLTNLVRPSTLGMILLFVALTLLFLGVLRFLAGRAYRRSKARESFDLLESASKLRPEHLGFRAVAQEEIVSSGSRLFYKSVYVSRVAVPYRMRVEENPQPTYTEAELARYLEGGDGRGFALLGPPLDGKTRTLYEIVRSMEGYKVVVPKPTEEVPEEGAFSLLLEGEHVVLLLDDLTRYVEAKLDLREFWERLRRHASLIVVASTCRDGPELNAVRQTSRHGLKWFYEERIHLELSLLKASLEDKKQLIEGIGKVQEGQDLELLPHLGEIAMEGTLRHMVLRFDRISHENPEQRDALRTLKVLSAAGVLPFTRERLLAVMRDVWEREPAHLGDCLDALAEQSFVSPGDHDQIEPEPAYLRYVVAYSPGKKPEDDFAILADALEGLEDIEGLFYLGGTHAIDLGDSEEARRCFDRAVRLQPGNPKVWHDKGKALQRYLEHLAESNAPGDVADVIEETLSAYEEALRLEPSFAEAWRAKGAILQFVTRYSEAIDALAEAVILKPDYHDAWCDKGTALVRADRYQEALDALEEAIRLDPSCPQAWTNKGKALSGLGGLQWETERYWEAVDAYVGATNVSSDYFEAWMHMGKVFVDLERYEEALEAFHKATAIEPEDHKAWEWKGWPLHELKRYVEYGETTAKALSLDPHCHLAWGNRGTALYHLGRPWVEVAQYFDKAIGLRPNDPDVWFRKAVVADNSGWHQEAVDTFDKALDLRPDFPEALVGRSIALKNLERYQEALNDLNRAIGLRPDEPEYWDRKGTLLRGMGRHQEAKEAFDKAEYFNTDHQSSGAS